MRQLLDFLAVDFFNSALLVQIFFVFAQHIIRTFMVHVPLFTSIGKPVNRAHHVDYVPTVLCLCTMTEGKVSLIEECEKRVLNRRMTQISG